MDEDCQNSIHDGEYPCVICRAIFTTALRTPSNEFFCIFVVYANSLGANSKFIVAVRACKLELTSVRF